MDNRQKSIVTSLGIIPGQDVLEIGCGPGVAASYVCECLDGSGSYLGIDRSSKAIQLAQKRNAAYIENGVAAFQQQDLEMLALESRRFDIIFAIRVGFFYREPEKAKAIVEKFLKPGGVVRSVYDTPGQP